MSSKSAIKLKAVFLLLVFSLNTLTGFACAVGINMGYNKTHHQHYQHPEPASKDDCCSGKVLQLLKVEKSIPQAEKITPSIFFTAFAAAYYNISTPFLRKSNTLYKYYSSEHHPPIPDIRIAIQSFQI